MNDHRVLLWCVAAWMCCIVVNCRMKFFDADGNALREEDILDKDWIVKDDKFKIWEDSYRRKSFLGHFRADDNNQHRTDEIEAPKNADLDKTAKEKCKDICNVDGEALENDKVKCLHQEDPVRCDCLNNNDGKISFNYMTKTCEDCDCGENYEKCSINEDGKKTCTCKDKFAERTGKCEACDCGENYEKCSLNEDGTKTCTCKDKFAEREGKCEACDCGDNYEKCSLDEDGVKTCSCKDKFAELNGKCEECKCGANSAGCTFKGKNEKECHCDDGYEDIEGTCTEDQCVTKCRVPPEGNKEVQCKGTRYGDGNDIECTCINNTLKFDPTTKTCRDCNCGDNSTGCTFKEGNEKECHCDDGYADKEGTCTECKCGPKSTGCTFKEENKKECHCEHGYRNNNGICTECDCGANSKNCLFKIDGTKWCDCEKNFTEIEGKCYDERCVNKCGVKEGVICKPTEGDVDCECKDPKKKFYSREKECKECDCGVEAKSCSFDEQGKKACVCNDKFKEHNGKCLDERCVNKCGAKEGVICQPTADDFDCACEDPEKTFYSREKECKRPCKENSDCKYGASCEEIRGVKFCDCPEGTSGDVCDIISDCTPTGKYANCTGGIKGTCDYDTSNEKAVCTCKEGRKLKDQSGYCAVCDCGDYAIDCNFLHDQQVCECKTNYSSNNGVCEKCYCGPDSTKCSFKDGKKICECNENFGDNGETCQPCECGKNSKGCSFREGKQICSCKDKFALKDGVCEACDCGKDSSGCSYEKGNKVCDCKNGFKENNGICKECNCGENSTACKFENGNKICECKDGNAQNGEKCQECVCGENTKECRFENGEKKCECKDKFAYNKGNCTACECGAASTGCTFKEETGKECKCKAGYGNNNGTCAVDQCFKKCGVTAHEGHEEISCTGTYYGDGGDIKCSCHNGILKFDSTRKKCRETCQDNTKCNNSATCEGSGDIKFCKCLKNTDGHQCEILTECGKGQKFEKCIGDRGQCIYDVTLQKATCKCTGTKLLDEKEGYCQDTCTKNEDCKNNKICFQKKYCSCEFGKTGDNCEKATGCTKELIEKCENADAECAFSKTAENLAACVCKDRNLVFKENEEKCVAKFCNEVGCKSPAKCDFDAPTKTAYCECPSGQYYDYNKETCSGPDKCLLRKTPCKENEVCNEGKCECKGEEKDGKCIIKFCKDGACVPGADCDEATATCKCGDGKYFTGFSCADVKCVKNPFDESCDCPSDMERSKDTKKCVPKGEKPACEKDCGIGYCVEDKCSCISGISVPHDGKCVLDKDKICASKELKDSSTCKCDGKYKQAKDSITCELRTCSDDDVKQECKNKKATCKMSWTGSVGYSCQCPAGYTENEEKGICTDSCSVYKIAEECSLEEQVCYNSYSAPNEKNFTCACAPPFRTKTKNCDDVASFAYLISGIPVMKQRYQMEYGIDYVRLNSDLMQSLAQMYNKGIFDTGYLHDYVEDGDVLKTSVWVRFNQNISGQLNRFKLQAQSFPKDTCEECDSDLYVWPPNVVLKGNDFNDVKAQSLSVCASAMKNTLCGEEADCKNNMCFCPRGYKTLEHTIKPISDKARLLRCEKSNVADLDECALGTHKCPGNTTCFKIPGTYICKCKPGYWKREENNQKDCVDMCTPSPCEKGTCSMKKDKFNCKCQAGYSGSYCDEADVNFASAKKSTVVVGAVLGTILSVGVLAALFFYIKKRKSSYSEDFMPAPRQDIASEMRERRPIRGVVNTSYE